jgi:hypothetical protein
MNLNKCYDTLESYPMKAELALWQAWDFSTIIVCSFVTDISPSSMR